MTTNSGMNHMKTANIKTTWYSAHLDIPYKANKQQNNTGQSQAITKCNYAQSNMEILFQKPGSCYMKGKEMMNYNNQN
jgi:hypothetical protein